MKRLFLCCAICLCFAGLGGCNLFKPVPTTGTLVVQSTPVGLNIRLDEKDTGFATPHTFYDLELRDYSYSVDLYREGQLMWGGYIQLKERGQTILDINVKSTIHLVSTPPGAAVELDGQPTGQVTPATIVYEGGYRFANFRLTFPGHFPCDSLAYSVQPGTEDTLSFTFEACPTDVEILFTWDEEEFKGKTWGKGWLCRVGLDGISPKKIIQTFPVWGGFLCWSPDRELLATENTSGGLLILDRDFNQVASFDQGGGAYSWDAESRTLLWAVFNLPFSGIYQYDRQTNSCRRLRESIWEQNPVLSPDRSTIAFVQDRSGQPQIWAMRADGSGARSVTMVIDSWGDERLCLSWLDVNTIVLKIRETQPEMAGVYLCNMTTGALTCVVPMEGIAFLRPFLSGGRYLLSRKGELYTITANEWEPIQLAMYGPWWVFQDADMFAWTPSGTAFVETDGYGLYWCTQNGWWRILSRTHGPRQFGVVETFRP